MTRYGALLIQMGAGIHYWVQLDSDQAIERVIHLQQQEHGTTNRHGAEEVDYHHRLIAGRKQAKKGDKTACTDLAIIPDTGLKLVCRSRL